MAAIAFDTLRYARKLIEAGVPERQAEVQAETMAEAFLFNVESLVTKDYLDTRLAEFEARFEARLDRRMDERFREQDGRFEKRFVAIENQLASLDRRLTALEAKVDSHFRLHSWILAAIAASTVIPALNNLVNSL
jgi:hypothetical protein